MWRIYYGDGTIFDADELPDKPARARDVQIIVQEVPEVGWITTHTSDYYIWRDERWYGVDIFGLFDYLLDSGLVLFGRTITREEFAEIYQRAKADKNLARKTGFLPGERKPD